MKIKTISVHNFDSSVWDKFVSQCKKEHKLIKYELERIIKANTK